MGTDRETAVEVFDAARRAFDGASAAAGEPVDCFYTVAGSLVRLHFAGARLVPFITPAFSHLTSPASADPALTICIWDGHTTTSHEPTLPDWWFDDSSGRGGVHTWHDDRVRTATQASTLSMLDSSLDVALYWVGDPDELTSSDLGSPLLRIFHWWMRGRDVQLILAGAVGTPEGGVLLAGKGRAGKSTVCLTALASGLMYAGDDYCLVSGEDEPWVHSVYASGQVDARDCDRFPSLAPALSTIDRRAAEKALYLFNDHCPERLSRGFPLRAVLVPRVTGARETMIRKVPASTALLALAPSTIFQLPGAGAEAFRTLSHLVTRVPSYLIAPGTDLSQIPRAILDVLSA